MMFNFDFLCSDSWYHIIFCVWVLSHQLAFLSVKGDHLRVTSSFVIVTCVRLMLIVVNGFL